MQTTYSTFSIFQLSYVTNQIQAHVGIPEYTLKSTNNWTKISK